LEERDIEKDMKMVFKFFDDDGKGYIDAIKIKKVA